MKTILTSILRPGAPRVWVASPTRFTLQNLFLPLMTALALVAQPASAASWQTVDDFQAVAGGAAAQAIGKDSSGNLYAAGSAAVDVNGDQAAVIRKSSDGGLSWSVVDFFSNGEPPMPLSNCCSYDFQYYAIGADANGNIYAAGSYFDDFADGA